MSKTFMAAALAVSALATTTGVQAAGTGQLSPFLGIGLTFGGEDIASVHYTDGSSKTLSSGGLVHLQAGLEYAPTGSPLAIQAVVGYHADSANAKNGDMSFSRVPVELIGLYDLGNQWRLGAGVRSVSGAKFSASDDASYTALGSKTKFKQDSVGWIAEVEYKLTPQAAVQARYVKESYIVDLYYNKPKIDGSHFGIFGVFYFR